MGPRVRGDDAGLLDTPSKRAVTQPRRIRGPRPSCLPAKAAVAFGNRNVVDAGLAAAHQAMLIEFPLLVAAGAMPLPAIVMPLILKAHGDMILVRRPAG